jgi:integrase/recombinase XerD
MLHSLFPKAHRRFLSLPLLGPIADGFDDWLAAQGYTRDSRCNVIRMLTHVDADLRHRHVKEVGNLTHPILRDCWRTLIRIYPSLAGTVRTLERYLAANAPIARAWSETADSAVSIVVEEYANYLDEVRGLASDTISHRLHTAQQFLRHLDEEGVTLKKIRRGHLESYITRAGKRLCRRTLQHHVSALRVFLRFLAMDGRVPAGLDSQMDTPRLYRLEQLPRALPWETVRTLLRSIDRTSAIGLRDYAMFLLIATYGLRSGEVIAITVDDIHWRQSRLRIHQSKTSSPLELPLTNEVSTALVKHLKRTPPPPPYRRVFLRMRAPMGALKRTAVGDAFQSVVQKSGLRIPFQGAHCMRHSLATHLLKNGTPLKTIGDILGHRSAASTSAYLRLATGDLREVSLPVPGRQCQATEEQR